MESRRATRPNHRGTKVVTGGDAGQGSSHAIMIRSRLSRYRRPYARQKDDDARPEAALFEPRNGVAAGVAITVERDGVTNLTRTEARDWWTPLLLEPDSPTKKESR
jgi:hypothetical protein